MGVAGVRLTGRTGDTGTAAFFGSRGVIVFVMGDAGGNGCCNLAESLGGAAFACGRGETGSTACAAGAGGGGGKTMGRGAAAFVAIGCFAVSTAGF